MTDRTALIICDMLEDFTAPGAPLEVPDARAIVPAIRERLEQARRDGTPVIYINDAHAPDDSEFSIWPPHAVADSPGAQVIEELAPGPGEHVITKTRYSGFYDTKLDATLQDLGVNHIVLAGVVSNICIMYTAVDAHQRGYRVSVPPDCVAGLDPDDHAFALRQITDVLKFAET